MLHALPCKKGGYNVRQHSSDRNSFNVRQHSSGIDILCMLCIIGV